MSAAPLSPLEEGMLASITPSPGEERHIQEVAARLLQRLNQELANDKIPGQATVQGSVAKGTWLHGAADLDVFLLLDPAVPQERLEQVALSLGPRVLKGGHRRYAQHPYVIGEFEGLQVDLVPAYRVATAGARMSAVDRTPFHTHWVRTHLAGLEGEVRLAKKWLKGVGAYGAQTALGGFSGYLVEVLVARLGSWRGFLDWLRADAQPRRLALGPDEVKDDVAVLVVADPVDPSRNCAAAVSAGTLARATAAARAYAETPGARFFTPAPPHGEAPETLHSALRAQGAVWLGLTLRPRTHRLDIVFPQFQKAARGVEVALEAAGFPVVRGTATATPDEEAVLLQWVAGDTELPATRLHRGPVESGAPNVARFREKWENNPDADGPVRVGTDGRLEVTLKVHHRTPHAWLSAHLRKLPLGKHVQATLSDARLLADPAQAPPEWAPTVADFVLDRAPWER